MSETPSRSDPKRLVIVAALCLAPLFAYGWSRWRAPSPQRYHRPRPARVTAPTPGVTSLAFSPDGLTLATANSDGTLSLWDVSQGTRRWHHDFKSRLPTHVAFSPDGRLLAGASRSSLSLWSLPSHRLVKTFAAPLPLVSSLAFSPDSQRIALSSVTGDIYKGNASLLQWNIQTGQKTRFLGRTAFIGSLAFSPDGQSLAATCGQNRAAPPAFQPVNFIRLWNATNGALRWEVPGSYPKADVAFSPDGQLMVAGNSTPQVLDTRTGKRARHLRVWPGSSVHVAFSPDGKTLAGGGVGSHLVLWDITNGQWIDANQSFGHFEATALAFSRDGKHLATTDGSRKVCLWDTSQLNIRRNLPRPQLRSPIKLLRTIDTF